MNRASEILLQHLVVSADGLTKEIEGLRVGNRIVSLLTFFDARVEHLREILLAIQKLESQ